MGCCGVLWAHGASVHPWFQVEGSSPFLQRSLLVLLHAIFCVPAPAGSWVRASWAAWA